MSHAQGGRPDRRAQINRDVALAEGPRLPAPPLDMLTGRGLDLDRWVVLCEAIFPTAKTARAILLAIDLCKARRYDIFRKPVHIVPVWNSQLRRQVETVWPGINSIQADAAVTGAWAGMDAPEFGKVQKKRFAGEVKRWENGFERLSSEEVEVEFPEWCSVTVYRVVHGQRCPFTVPVYWEEAYATVGGTKLPNDMWQKRPRGQLIKCATAASLRAAFPEAPDMTAEEMEGQTVEGGGVVIPGEAEDVTDSAPARPSRGPVEAAAEPAREPEPWEAMAWPHAVPDGSGYEDLEKPEAWLDRFRSRLQRIVDASALPEEAKKTHIERIEGQHTGVFDMLRKRGGEATVDIVTGMIKAAKAGKPMPRDPTDPTERPRTLALAKPDGTPVHFTAGDGKPPIEQQWLKAWNDMLGGIHSVTGLTAFREKQAGEFAIVEAHWKDVANAAHDATQARVAAVKKAAAERSKQPAGAK